MTKAHFGQRGTGAMNVAQTVAGPIGGPRTGETKGGLATLIVLLVCGTTGLAGLGLHRFWLGHVRAGLVFLGLVGALAAMAMFFAVRDADDIGRPLFLSIGLVVIYGCIEACVMAVARAVKTIVER